MSKYDIINGGFELVGAYATWLNVVRLRRDRTIRGVAPLSMGFFAGWGLWNLVYYPHLEQWFSTVGGALLVTGNITWLLLGLYYSRQDT